MGLMFSTTLLENDMNIGVLLEIIGRRTLLNPFILSF